MPSTMGVAVECETFEYMKGTPINSSNRPPMGSITPSKAALGLQYASAQSGSFTYLMTRFPPPLNPVVENTNTKLQRDLEHKAIVNISAMQTIQTNRHTLALAFP